MQPVQSISLLSLNFTFPSFSKRMLRDTSPVVCTELAGHGYESNLAPTARLFPRCGLNAFGRRRTGCSVETASGGSCCSGLFRITNCEFFGADGRLIKFSGFDSAFVNNKISWIDFSGQNVVNATGGIATFPTDGANATLYRNTFENNGAPVAYRRDASILLPCDRAFCPPGLVRAQMYSSTGSLAKRMCRTTVQCCTSFLPVLLRWLDGRSLFARAVDQQYSIVRNNWAHDSSKGCYRCRAFYSYRALTLCDVDLTIRGQAAMAQ